MSPPGVINHPMLLSVATPSRDNMPCTTTKGLLNEPGQNNCFLNSAVQVLWHLDIFRRSFRDLMGHACMADSCIFCALKVAGGMNFGLMLQTLAELFSQLQFSNESALPPDALRKALAESFSDQQRFQLGFMDDAAECFENILLRIHMHIAHEESQDMCNAQHCIPHQKFAMTLVEQTVCGSCGATSEPLSYTQMVHYVSTSTLVYQVRNGGARASPYNHTTFGQLLRKAGNMGDVRMCPSHCGAVIQISRTLMNWPEIVSIGLVWNSERPSLEHIMEVFSTIGTSMLLGDVFTSVTDKKWTENCTHNLVGVVTYYGKHYSTFFFHTKLRVWIYFDDATVRQVGPHWEQVVEKCRKGRYQPLLLLYATPDGTPVNTDNAPKQVTQILPQKTTPKASTTSQNFLRRSVTPSPEKPNVGNTRRAITPNPDGPLNQKPPLPKPCNEYQNLSVIQSNLHAGTDIPDGYVGRKEPYVRKLDMEAINKPSINIHRTLSNGSSSGIEGMSDHNFPRRRDSGNWSGDRNSASSASSTTMDNPYLYLIGKVPPGNVPESPTLVKSDSSSAGSAIYDAGYDSYSLSSNDSSTMTTLQHMMKIGHLAKIPEDYNNLPNQVTQSCDILCDEADKLLVKSRQLEDDHDLVLALALCNAAATKARAAMNAPYNNPQTLTLARMKHNTCIMRARSLHRRMTQNVSNKDTAPPEIRHTREGSSGSGRHSRQSSRDKGQHSRQNSKELLTNIPPTEKIVNKNIEIYATLPKRKDLLKNRIDNISLEEPVEYVSNDKQPPKESRGFFSRSKQKDSAKREKRSRSEDRSKRVVEFTLTPEIIEIKPKLKEEKTEKQEKDGKSKKQHKIRRKLLMGGLIKRKNRSMPDLTDANPEMEATAPQPQLGSVDDSKVGLKGNVDNTQPSMSGYLSEGHLEFNANNTNPNLKKSKLMRKSFYASAGKILSVPKVPPPPPLRTTSQLTNSKPQLNGDEIKDSRSEYQNLYELSNSIKSNTSIIDMLRYEQSQQRSLNESNNSNNSFNSSISSYNNQPVTLITTADVHRESRGSVEHLNTPSVDEVDCRPSRLHLQTLELPPYPSPAGSTVHSRQASEEFPPPPPPLDLSALDEHLPQCVTSKVPSSSLLGQLQNKREQIFSFETSQPLLETTTTSTGNTWLRELQAKQAALKVKRINSFNKKDEGADVVNTQKFNTNDIGLKTSSVKDLTSKFEVKKPEISDCISVASPVSSEDKNVSRVQSVISRKQDIETIAPEQIAEEIREVERINASLQETLNYNKQSAVEERKKQKLGKKKSVSFCDQVILVATAEDQEDDSYIPNPILERVLRSAINKPENNDGDIKTSEEVVKVPQDDHLPNNNFNQNSMEEQKSSSDNLFDITMRNTMENSKIMNPNLITKIASSEPPKSTVPQQSTYSSVAFAQNRSLQPNSPSTSGPPSQPLYSVNQYSQYPNNVPQQSQLQGFSHSEGYTGLENNPSAIPYNHFAPHSPSAVQQPIYQQQPIYSGNSSPQYSQYSGHNNSQQGYGYASQPIHPQQQNQQYYHPTQNPQYGGHYQQRPNHYSPVASYPQNQHHVTSMPPQNMYSSPPHGYPPQPNHQKSYGKEGQPRQPQNTMQQNYSGQNAKMNYQYPPQPLKGHNQVSRTSGLYQSVPFSSKPNPHPVYQRTPTSECNMNQNQVAYNPYQRLPSKTAEPEPQKLYDVYHRVPSPHGDRDAYQQLPPNLKKSVSFDPSALNADRSDPSLPKAIVTPILVNNANNSIPDKTKCNLCRKKIVASSNLYCADCEYYMSRFKPKT